MALSPQLEKFAQAVANGKYQAEAYREAYPKSANWKDETVWSKASRLMVNGKVCTRVQELRAELSAKNLWTREDSVKALREVVANPDKASDIVAAVKELNTMYGFKDTRNDSMRLLIEMPLTLADFYAEQADTESGAA